MVYVDELRLYGLRQWCHMVTDGPIDELHQMADRIGLKREWFQTEGSTHHYDLNWSKRHAALMAGATPISCARLGVMLMEGKVTRR